MKRMMVSTLTVAVGLWVGAPSPAAAQLSASVHVSWHWSDDGWRAGPVVDGHVVWHDGPEYRPAPVRPAAVRVRPAPPAFRVPPGHLPPPGLCRAWIPGVPPGHQPPPAPCGRVFRSYHGPDYVILHTPRHAGRDWRDYEGWDRRYRSGDRGLDWEDHWDDRDDDRWDDWDDDRWDDDHRWDRRGERGDRDKPGRGRGRGRP